MNFPGGKVAVVLRVLLSGRAGMYSRLGGKSASLAGRDYLLPQPKPLHLDVLRRAAVDIANRSRLIRLASDIFSTAPSDDMPTTTGD